jgi:hypothetical protein
MVTPDTAFASKPRLRLSLSPHCSHPDAARECDIRWSQLTGSQGLQWRLQPKTVLKYCHQISSLTKLVPLNPKTK